MKQNEISPCTTLQVSNRVISEFLSVFKVYTSTYYKNQIIYFTLMNTVVNFFFLPIYCAHALGNRLYTTISHCYFKVQYIFL